MKDFFKTRQFKTLLLVLALLVGLIIGAERTGLLKQATNSIVNAVLSPIENTSTSITGRAVNFLQRFVDAGVYIEENQRLQAEVQELQNQLIEFEKFKIENEQLREAVGLKGRFVESVLEPARIVERDPLDRFYSFTIDKGEVDGVKVNDPVVTADGLVGRVESVTKLEARVMTLYNPKLEVSAYSVTSRDYGVMTGGDLTLSDQNQGALVSVSKESLMEAGDTIITAGNGVFPANAIIGKVESIADASTGITKTAVVNIIVDIQNIKEVFVITSFKGQATEYDFGENAQLPPPEESSVPEESVPPESSAPPVEVPPPVITAPESSQNEAPESSNESSGNPWGEEPSWGDIFGNTYGDDDDG